MHCSFLSCGQTLGDTAAIGWHAVKACRAVPIRGKRNPLPIGCPDGPLIIALKRQLLDRRLAGEVVDPDDVLAALYALNNQLFSIGRQAGAQIFFGRHIDGFVQEKWS